MAYEIEGLWVKNRSFEKTESVTVRVEHQVGPFEVTTLWQDNELYKIVLREMDTTSGFARTFLKVSELEALRDVINDALKEVECVPES